MQSDNMRPLMRPLFLIVFVLLVPILPFLVFGEPFEAWPALWQDAPPSRSVLAALTVGLLALDILLPVPSSVVNTLAGAQLGAPLGTAVCWLGMSLGAVLGFILARYGGRPLAERFCKAEQLRQMERLSFRYGPGILVLFRAVPVLAEASVLLVGLNRLTWRRFLPPVMLSNLGIALAYAWFGHYAGERQWLPLALGIAVALPLLLTIGLQGWLAARSGP
jgi:membrane protein DedA with SNARE-associated domain